MMKVIKWILAAAILLAAGPMRAQQADENAIVKVGDPVPAFTVQMVDGTTVDIADLRGKVVVVNFWATWCPYCVAELKVVQEKMLDRIADADLVFLAIAREEGLDKVLPFRKQGGYTFPMGIDPDRSIFDRFAKNSIPRNYVIDRQGTIVAAEVGYTPAKFDELVEKIEAELAK